MNLAKACGLSALVLAMCGASACAQQNTDGAGQTALTIYNQDFAVARTTVDLDLKAGANEVTTTKVTNMLEPDSVVLRDPSGKRSINVVEQNYDAALATQPWMLQRYEGQTISFEVQRGDKVETVQGRIVRAGGSDGTEPLIEVNGKLQFQLPGLPLFPASTDGLLLKPTLRWQLEAERADHYSAELDYITHGLGWSATYNVVMPEDSGKLTAEKADLVGWVTINNNSGTDFPEAKIQLMAGDVAKLQTVNGRITGAQMMAMGGPMAKMDQVTQKTFDDFHLYDLHRLATLKDRETKQIEFLHSAEVGVTRKYEFDGATDRFYPLEAGSFHNEDPNFGVNSQTKVSVRLEFKNSEQNRLGVPLPAGRIRFYRKDTGGQMEFVGESAIDHTPKDETVKVTTGNAFDVVGERKRMDFHIDSSRRTMDENFEIKLKNRKEQPVSVAVVEHLNRGNNWEITEKSGEFSKRDSQTIEFPVNVAANSEQTLTYSVHYTW